MFNTDFSIRLKPHGLTKPIIRFGINSIENKITLDQEMELKFNRELLPGNHKFILELVNKTNSTPDMAIEILSVTFEGITVDRFKWANNFYPVYPKSQRDQSPVDYPSLISQVTQIGSAGRWEMEFTAPIFTWIHQLEHLGWIYD